MTTPPDGAYSPGQLALVRRQIAVWEGRDTEGPEDTGSSKTGSSKSEAAALADWDPRGVLIAPRGVRVQTLGIPAAIARWRQDFTDLRVELTTLMSSTDETWLAIEWTWHVTRRSDDARSSTLDAIIVALADGKILRWQEYFDTHGSVEFSETTAT